MARRTWTTAKAADYFVDLGKIAENAGKESEHAAYLGVAYITCDQEMSGLRHGSGLRR